MRYLQNNTMRLLLPIALFATAPQLTFADNSFVQNNLVSDGVCGTDPAGPKLINAWGIDRSPTSPWWVNANGSGVSCLFTGTGGPVPLVVTVPPPSGSSPTGIVFNPTGDFQVDMGAPAHFIFATEDGTISGWNSGTVAIQKVATPNAVYKGITMGVMNGANVLYAANFHAGTVDVFDAAYMPVTMPSGAFKDFRVPAGFAPFNVDNINGFIVVTFAKQDADAHDDVAGPGNGYVDIFSPAGVLMKRLEHNKFLNSPGRRPCSFQFWRIGRASVDRQFRQRPDRQLRMALGRV